MLSAAVIAGCCVWIASAQSALTIENLRPTFGSPGPERPVAGVFPGDTYYLSFDLKGVKVDSTGTGKVRLETEASDAAGNRVFRMDSGESVVVNALGGDGVHSHVRLELGPKTAPGKYKLKVTATDIGSKATASKDAEIEVLPPAFAIVRVSSGVDQNLASTGSVFGLGQALYLGFAVVGFQTDAATKHPKLRFEMKVKSNGAVVSTATQVGEVNASQQEKVPAGAQMIPGRFLLPLSKAGQYTVEVTATDLVNQKVAGPVSFQFHVVSPK